MSDAASRNRLASDWMHRGMDLAQENSPASLEQAVRCFDEAIALRRALPLEENPDFRYGLSAGWINRGDALARLGEHRVAEAITSYDEALALLKTLPLADNPLFPRRLAIAWINRGAATQGQGTSAGLREAEQAFREALGVLGQSFAEAIADRNALLAGAWTNLAGLLAGRDNLDAEGVRGAAEKALELAKVSERDDLASAVMALKARHALCRASVRELAEKKMLPDGERMQSAAAAEDALELAEHWNFHESLAGLAREIFRFGCRLHENGSSGKLVGFLMRQLGPGRFDEKITLDQPTCDAIRGSIFSALGKLQDTGFQFVATPEVQSRLSEVERLRKVEERLKEVIAKRSVVTS